MKPRDRYLASANGEEVFPVPVDVFENAVYPGLETGLCRHFGLTEGDHEGVLRALGAGLRRGSCPYIGPPQEEAPLQRPMWPFRKVFRNIWGTWEGYETYSDRLYRPLASAETIAQVDAYAWPNPDWFDYGRVAWFYDTPETALRVPEFARRHADFARLLGGWNPVFSRVMDLFGMETGLMHLALRPDLVEAAVAHIDDFLEQFYTRLAAAGHDYFDFIGFGDDFANQRSMMVRPETWRRLFLPVWRRLFAVAHRHGMKASMHSCGAIRPVLGDLIDAGLDMLEVVQVTAAGMDPVELKREFGGHLTFHGAIDSQGLLPRGTTYAVRQEVRRLARTLGKGGRYILCSMHFMMDDIPVENAVAMYDEARHYIPSGTRAHPQRGSEVTDDA